MVTRKASRGDMFLAKFDSDGYLIDVLTTTGVAEVETATTLAWAGDDIILNAVFKGTGATTDAVTLDGHTLALPSGQPAMLVARLSTDLKVQWTRLFQCDGIGSRSSVLQYNHVNVIGDNLWLTGMGNFTLYDDLHTDTIVTVYDNVREGYIIRCDASTGEWLAATTSKVACPDYSGITGWLGGFEAEDNDNFYVYGYNWGGIGVSLFEFDKTTLDFKQFCSLITGGSMTTANEMVASGDKLYIISRGKQVTTAGWELLSIGQTEPITTQEWAAIFAAYQLPFTAVTGNESQGGDDWLHGDVNLDGEVSIADVGAVVDVILDGGTDDSALFNRADVNGDGEISIGDVGALVDIILL